jgi:type IV pilus assembly protein PilN
MHVDINLASHPYEDVRRFWLRWGGAVAALGVVTLVLGTGVLHGWLAAQKARKLIAQGQEHVASLDKERTDAEAVLNRPENSSVRDRSQFLNDLFQRKAFSWTKVFEDLERVMPPGLHVVSIRPEMSPENQLEIKLVVAGDSRDRALELVRKMEGSQRFQQTQIEQENSQPGRGAGDVVEFDISALYVPEVGNQSKRGAP